MKRRLLLSALSLSVLLYSCSDDGSDDYASNKQTIRFVELSYGIDNHEEQTPEQLKEEGDELNNYSNFRITTETDTVPARIGARFGVKYMLESAVDNAVKLKKVWIAPAMIKDDEGTVYNTLTQEMSRMTNEENYASYTISDANELKKGKWQLCIYYKKHLLYRKIFVLI